jgi:hypothetical protein
MSLLHDLAENYGCDKLHSHSYIPFYESTLPKHVTSLLEIGIGYENLMLPFVPFYTHGASLLMWENYFPHAEIFSCDIRPETLINGGRIHSVVADQSDADSLKAMAQGFGGNFDVIIDDGSHQREHQLLTAQVLMPYLRPGGLYCIEDVMEFNCEELAAAIGGHVWKGTKRIDDNLVWCRK